MVIAHPYNTRINRCRLGDWRGKWLLESEHGPAHQLLWAIGAGLGSKRKLAWKQVTCWVRGACNRHCGGGLGPTQACLAQGNKVGQVASMPGGWEKGSFGSKKEPNLLQKGEAKVLTYLEARVELLAISRGPGVFIFLAKTPRKGR